MILEDEGDIMRKILKTMKKFWKEGLLIARGEMGSLEEEGIWKGWSWNL